VTTTITGRTSNAIHLTYPDKIYEVGQLGQYFTSVDEAWRLIARLAILGPNNTGGETWGRRLEQAEVEGFMVDSEIESPRLMFERIRLSSPLEISLAIEAVGGTGITIYALHLLSAVLRDPERIGGWLPRLAAGWHRARKDAELARQERFQHDAPSTELSAEERQRAEGLEDTFRRDVREAEVREAEAEVRIDEAVTGLVDLSDTLKELSPVNVTVDVETETPKDIAAAVSSAD
jgi:hypothetical protein